MKQKEENQEAREIEIEDGEQTATESNQEQTESTEQKAEDEQPTADDNSTESQLAKALEIDIQSLLQGQLNINCKVGENMNRLKF